MAITGKVFLWAAALVSLFCLVALLSLFFSRDKKSDLVKAGYWGIIGVFGTVTVAGLILTIAFITQDNSFAYVASHSNKDMATIYRISAFWAGHQGSLLFWLWVLTGLSAWLAVLKVRGLEELDSYALFVINVVQLFFLAVLLFAADPFEAAVAGTASRGMNPMLLHWAMILHPPTLFVGYAGITVPFGYAIAALIKGDGGNEWVKASQKWNIFAWLFLSIGIFLGAAWAYVVLGWGGYWGWDPVENASLLPWLTGTALIHSFTAYRCRKTFKRWSLALAIITFFLVILGTFVTRSGIIQSVHAFEKNWIMVGLFGGFMVLILIAGFVLIAVRWREFAPEHHMTSFFSRDFSYYLNNIVLLVGAMIIVVASVILPSPLFEIQLKTDFYNRLAQPIGILYLALIVLCPMFAWRKTNPAKFEKLLVIPGIITGALAIPLFFYWRYLENLISLPGEVTERSPGLLNSLGITVNPLGYLGLLVAVFAIVSIFELLIRWIVRVSENTGRGYFSSLSAIVTKSPHRVAAYVAHLGVAIIVIGLIGSAMYTANFTANFSQEKGGSFKAQDYTLKFVKIDEKRVGSEEDPAKVSKQIITAELDLYGKGDKYLGRVYPKIVGYSHWEQPVREVDIRYEFAKDVFIIFEGLDEANNVYMSVFINPLISYVWLGSILLILGTCIAFWPRKES